MTRSAVRSAPAGRPFLHRWEVAVLVAAVKAWRRARGIRIGTIDPEALTAEEGIKALRYVRGSLPPWEEPHRSRALVKLLGASGR